MGIRLRRPQRHQQHHDRHTVGSINIIMQRATALLAAGLVLLVSMTAAADQPERKARRWRTDFAAFVLIDDNPATQQEVVDAVAASGGQISLSAPAAVLLGWVTDVPLTA